jgi:hypothetical protein
VVLWGTTGSKLLSPGFAAGAFSRHDLKRARHNKSPSRTGVRPGLSWSCRDAPPHREGCLAIQAECSAGVKRKPRPVGELTGAKSCHCREGVSGNPHAANSSPTAWWESIEAIPLLWPFQQLRQLGDVGRDPPRLVARVRLPVLLKSSAARRPSHMNLQFARYLRRHRPNLGQRPTFRSVCLDLAKMRSSQRVKGSNGPMATDLGSMIVTG